MAKKKQPIVEETEAERAERIQRMADTFKRWLADGSTWIGVFENQAMDSANFGQRISLQYDTKDFDQATIGKDKAPDTQFGAGWRYILVAKCKTVEEALQAMAEK